MRDAFYTILVIWIIWRIINAVSAYGAKQSNTQARNSDNYGQSPNNNREGETVIIHAPPVSRKISDDEGEYVDFEEIKEDNKK